MRQVTLPVTGSGFLGTISTGAVHGDSDGAIQPLAKNSLSTLSISADSSAVNQRGVLAYG